MRRFPHLVAAAEAFDDLLENEHHTVRVGTTRWGIDAETRAFVPLRGGRCYEVDYVLGEGREAILRTAALRAGAR